MNPIKIESGYISGSVIGEKGKEVYVYRGIPYAAPPTGELRWKPPQPVTPWQGIRECTQFSPWAAQKFPTVPIYQVMTESGMSEDCLYLNVLTPARKNDDKLPVLVWIHGGMLTILSGNMRAYNTQQLPQHGAVVVTINHRLGPFGYMAHPELSEESEREKGIRTSGNYGQLDLIEALKWVKRNIASFGGDPDCVTIFGQSGGASKVKWLMTSPLSSGLFHRAWSMSSNVNEYIGIPTLSEAEENGIKLADRVGAANIAELRSRTWQEIVQSSSDIEFQSLFTVDGWSLPEPITETFQVGRQEDVPYMIGFVENEGEGFHAVRSFVPTIKQRESKVYAYVFSGVPNGWKKTGATSWHSIDVNYVFSSLTETLGSINNPYFNYYIKPRCSSCEMKPGINADDEWLADTMKKILIRFATTGDPNLPDLGTKWPAYRPEEDRYLNIDIEPEVKSGFSTWKLG